MAEYNAGTVKATMTADGKGYHTAVDGIKKKDQELKQSAQEVKTSYKEMGIAAGATFTAITAGIWKSVDANNQLKAAMMGLDSIATGTVGTYSKIQAELERIREEGMIPLNNAITAYKNLLMRYQDEETAIRMFNRLADAAAFGRQGQLSLGEAIQSASEGLKNENSVLVDNAGVTKNVSVMWKEYAAQIGKTVGQLTDAEKRQAEMNGIIEETRHQVGDLAWLQGTLAGELSKASAAGRDTAAAFGDAMEPAVSSAVVAYTGILQGTKEFISNNPDLVAGVTAGAFAFTGLSMAMAGANALIPKLIVGFKTLFISSGPIGWGILAVSALTAVIVGLHTAQEKQLQQMKELSKEYRQQSNEIYDLVSEHKELAAKTEKTADEKDRLKTISERLIELVPGIVKGYDDEGRAILDLNIALEDMVEKKREALKADKELLEGEIRDAEKRKKELEGQRAFWEIGKNHPRGGGPIHLPQDEERLAQFNKAIKEAQEREEQWLTDIDQQINQLDLKLEGLNKQRDALEAAIQGTTMEAVIAENERRRTDAERKRAEIEEALQQQQQIREREKLEAELADRLFELTQEETRVKMRELEKQRDAYKAAQIEQIEVNGEIFSLTQWFEIEKTKLLQEEEAKRLAIQEQYAKEAQDQRRRLYSEYLSQFEDSESAALMIEEIRYRQQLEQAEWTAQEIELINQIHEMNNEKIRKQFSDRRIARKEEVIRAIWQLEKDLTAAEKEEILKRLQAELAALETMQNADQERIQALKNIIKELSETDLPNLTDQTKEWGEELARSLARAIVYGEDLGKTFENLLRQLGSEWLYSMFASMMGLSNTGLFQISKMHVGGLVEPIRAHSGLNLAPDEVPIIAQTGERVLSREQNAAFEEMMSRPQQVIFQIQAVDAESFVSLARRNPEAIVSAVVEDYMGDGLTRKLFMGRND